MSEELKPCPFCGGTAARNDVPATEDEGMNAGGSYIECQVCWACTKIHFGEKTELVESWNNRFSPSKDLRPVQQDWVLALPLMQQTVLMTAVRGPDGIAKYGPVKLLLRWYRRCVLLSAMDRSVIDHPGAYGGGSFTGPSLDGIQWLQNIEPWEKGMHQLVDEYLQAVDALPHHFQMHFLHAAEIVGYKHSDMRIRAWWHRVYVRLVHDLHLWPETEDEMDRRLGDDREAWLDRADPATVD